MKKPITKNTKKKATKRKPKAISESEFSEDKPEFCTECDKDLDEFWMSKRADNPEWVRKRHEKCVKSGKFKGEFCSKLFIISPFDSEESWMRED